MKKETKQINLTDLCKWVEFAGGHILNTETFPDEKSNRGVTKVTIGAHPKKTRTAVLTTVGNATRPKFDEHQIRSALIQLKLSRRPFTP